MPGCIVDLSENFIFETPSFQTSCNTVYEYKKAVDTRANATVTGNTYKFKTDFERMQYLIGLFGRTNTPTR